MTDEEAIKDFLIKQHKAGIDKSYEEIVEKLKFVKNDKKECQEMTNSEIIKGIENYITSAPASNEVKAIFEDIISFINRQQAEIEKLKEALHECHKHDVLGYTK